MAKQTDDRTIWNAIELVMSGQMRRTDFTVTVNNRAVQVSIYRITDRLFRMDLKPEVQS